MTRTNSDLLMLVVGGAMPSASSGSTVMATNDLLTPLSAGLEGLSFSDTKTAPTTFQVGQVWRIHIEVVLMTLLGSVMSTRNSR